MKTFQNHAAQGEISIMVVSDLPAGCKPIAPERGTIVIGHSETGHHHTIDADRADVFESTTAPAGMRILYAIVKKPASLDHQRPFDTHEAIGLQPGMYEFRIGREYDPYAEVARLQVD